MRLLLVVVLLTLGCYQTSTSDGRTTRVNTVTGRTEVLVRGPGGPTWREVKEPGSSTPDPLTAFRESRKSQRAGTPAAEPVQIYRLAPTEETLIRVTCSYGDCTIRNGSSRTVHHVAIMAADGTGRTLELRSDAGIPSGGTFSARAQEPVHGKTVLITAHGR